MLNINQIKRHEEVFATNTDAIDYVINHSKSLYGEPLLVQYGDPEAPSVILAIGSKTNEVDGPDDVVAMFNRYTFIDITKVEGEIEDLDEKIEAIAKSLTIVPVESDTIKLFSEKTDDGTYVSGDVKVADTQIFDDVVTPGIILATEDGIYTYVNLDYDAANDTLTFQVNGDKKEFQLENNYVVSGMYMTNEETIHLKMRQGNDVVIDVKNLINEWTVEGYASATPIVLTKERVKYSSTTDEWQDILRGDVRIVQGEDNILETHNNGEALYVKGVASNIKYKNNIDSAITTVKEGLDKAIEIARQKTISLDSKNIIYAKQDGLFASSKLSYVPEENKLVFTTSNVNGGETVTDINLVGVELFTDVRYDPVTEELVIVYKDNTGTEHECRIPLGGMIDEWEPDNHNHTVTLIKNRQVSGKDKVSADVNITSRQDNILVKDGLENLYVKGTADNIKYTNVQTVEGKLDELTNILNTVSAKTNANASGLTEEIARSTQRDSELQSAVDANASAISNEIIRATSAETTLQNAITNEVSRSTAKDTEQDNRLTDLETAANSLRSDLTAEETRATSAETAIQTSLQASLANEVNRATAAETALNNKINTVSGAIDTNKHVIDVLGGQVSGLQADIQSESARAIEAEQTNAAAIHAEEDRATTAENAISSTIGSISEKVNTISGAVADEATARQAADTGINTNITQLTNRIAAEETRSLSADLVLSGDMTTAKSDIAGLKTTVQDNTSDITDLQVSIQSGLTAEQNRATTVETALQTAINNEVARATAKDAELENKVSSATLTFDETTTVRLVKDASNNVTGTLKIANANDNMVVVDNANHGVYANVDLLYDGGTNKLTFKTTSQNGVVTKELQLNGGSLIDSISYDADHKNLIIIYTDQHGQQQTVTLGVEELFNDFEVENPATNSAVQLTKTPGENGNPAKLSARVIFSGLESNIARFDSNGIYVDGTQISANSQSINAIDQRVTVLESRADGVDGDIENLYILSGQVQNHESAITNLQSSMTVVNNEITQIESNIQNITASTTDITSALTQEITRATTNENRIENELGGQIRQNKLKVYPDDASIVLTEDQTGNGTYIKLGVLDAGYL